MDLTDKDGLMKKPLYVQLWRFFLANRTLPRSTTEPRLGGHPGVSGTIALLSAVISFCLTEQG
jgi:hypothetical protein